MALYFTDPSLVEIKEHVFDIPRRLREIDDALRVYYNKQTGKYEVHDLRAKGATYVLSVPVLDVRLETRLRMISLENRKPADILQYIDEANEKVIKASHRKLHDIALGLADDLRFAGKPVVQGFSV